MKKKDFLKIIFIIGYLIFIGISFLISFKPGMEISKSFFKYALNIIIILPCAFLLIGLFEVWVKRKTVEKYLGQKSDFSSYFWAVLLGGCTLGPLIIALPISYTLFKKGAKLGVIFTYLGAASVCRIPMTVFEASYLGLKFTIIRYLVSIPLFIITSILFGKYLEHKKFKINKTD